MGASDDDDDHLSPWMRLFKHTDILYMHLVYTNIQNVKGSVDSARARTAPHGYELRHIKWGLIYHSDPKRAAAVRRDPGRCTTIALALGAGGNHVVTALQQRNDDMHATTPHHNSRDDPRCSQWISGYVLAAAI